MKTLANHIGRFGKLLMLIAVAGCSTMDMLQDKLFDTKEQCQASADKYNSIPGRKYTVGCMEVK